MQARETNLQELNRAYSHYLTQSTQITLQKLEAALQLSAVIAINTKRSR